MKTKAEKVIEKYVAEYLVKNKAARFAAKELAACGIGIRPLIDHVTFRTTNVERRAQEFIRLGFKQDKSVGPGGIVKYADWWAKVYRKPGLPAIFIDQAFAGKKGATSIIPQWVAAHSDSRVHHIAVLVDEIERAVKLFKYNGIRFSSQIVGSRDSDLRQIFSVAERRKGVPFSVLELIERRRGYTGFQPPRANDLMRSSTY